MPKPSEVNPSIPVWNQEQKEAIESAGVAFDIRRVTQFVSPSYGPTWRLTVVRHDTGEQGLILFAGNMVRDDAFGSIRDAIASDGPVGPCILRKVKVGQKGRETWEIADAPEPERPAKASKGDAS